MTPIERAIATLRSRALGPYAIGVDRAYLLSLTDVQPGTIGFAGPEVLLFTGAEWLLLEVV